MAKKYICGDPYKQNENHSQYTISHTAIAPSYRVPAKYHPVVDENRSDTDRLLKDLFQDSAFASRLSERVFGTQLKRTGAVVQNLDQLLNDRSQILDRNLREINQRRNEIANRLSIARRPNSIRTPQEVARIEKMLFDLESQRRDEYLNFWKDLARTRGDLLEAAGGYQAAKNRASLFGGIGESDG